MRATARRARDRLALQRETDIDAATQRGQSRPDRTWSRSVGTSAAIGQMGILIVEVRPVSIIAFDTIACDIAPRTAGVTRDMRVIVRCIYRS